MSGVLYYGDVPLDTHVQSIRLVTILPAMSSGLVACRLRSFPLDTIPEYTALSYTWGNEKAIKRILVNDKLLYVRENLWQFLNIRRHALASNKDSSLVYLNSPDVETESFWIDALCIDQDNVQERNHQVGLMRQIFGNVVDSTHPS
jgi:hypothetical protein